MVVMMAKRRSDIGVVVDLLVAADLEGRSLLEDGDVAECEREDDIEGFCWWRRGELWVFEKSLNWSLLADEELTGCQRRMASTEARHGWTCKG